MIKNKKVLILIVLLIILILTLILVNIFYKKLASNQVPPVISKQVEYPQIQIIKTTTQITPLTDSQQIKFPDKVSAYQVFNRAPLSEQVSEKLANSFGINRKQSLSDSNPVFDHHQSQGEEVYVWQQDGKSLVQFPKSGVFEYSAPLSKQISSVDIQKAKEAVLNLLTKNTLLSADYNLYADYISLPDFSVTDNNNFSAYRIIVEPKVNNISMLSFKNSGNMIIAYLAKDFSFFKFDYYYVPVNKIDQSFKLKPVSDLMVDVISNKIQPSFFYLPSNVEYLDSNSINISQVILQKVELVYFLSDRNNQIIYPSYKITAQIKTADNIGGNAIYLLPASK